MKNLSNPLAHAVLLAALLLISDIASAQNHTRILCSACRDPNVHPSDFGNAAFNALRSPNNGFTFDDLDVVEIVNPAGLWAWVDIDCEMVTINLGFKIPTFVIPTGNLIIEITDANARMTAYVIDLEIPNQLSVGTGIGPGYNPRGGSGASGPGEGSSGGDSGHYVDSGDYWDGWESGYGGQTWRCFGDFSDPYDTVTICGRR